MSYVVGVSSRVGNTASERDGLVIISTVRLLLGCYVHFCSERFVAHGGRGGSALDSFRTLLGSCFASSGPSGFNAPAMTCYTSRLRLSTGCFKSLVGGRANSSTRRCVLTGAVSATGR